MWLYVIGPMAKNENLNRAAFEDAQDKLWDAGYHVLTPYDVVSPNMSYEKAMKANINTMLTCDGVALLEGWNEDRNTKLEKQVAIECGLDVQPLCAWLVKVPSDSPYAYSVTKSLSSDVIKFGDNNNDYL